MVDRDFTQNIEVPRGPEHSQTIALPNSVNTAHRRARTVIMSSFDSHYNSLHDLRAEIKQKFDAITDASATLLSLTTSDEINKLATATSPIIVKAQIMVNKYNDSVNALGTCIAGMEISEQGKEQEHFDQQMESSDGHNLPIGGVRLSSLMSEKKTEYSLSLSESVNRVKLLSSLAANSPPSQHPSSSTPSSAFPSHVPTDTVKDELDHSLDESRFIGQLSTSISQLVTQISSSAIARPNIALPPVKLETFDGSDITRWPAYRYQINQLILNQPHLTEVEKAFYLRSSLRGVAFNLVASIPVHKNFLEKIVSRLESQYGRHNLSQAKLIQSLRSIRSKSHSVTDQLTAVQSMISIAHSIHSESGIDSLCMQQMIAECINPRYITFVGHRKPKSLLAALELIENDLLTEYEDALTISAFTSVPQSTVYSTTSTEQNSLIDQVTPKFAVSPPSNRSPPNPNTPKKPQCVYCGNHSFSGECTQVLSIRDRKEILRQKSLCHSCFSPSHSTNDCSRTCPSCKGKHHKSLCEKPSVPHTSVNTVTTDQSILVNNRLMTAPVMLANSSLTQCSMANVLLDPGAQASLISRTLATSLHLSPMGHIPVCVNGLKGSHDPSDSPTSHDIVELQLLTKTGRETIKALVRDTDDIIGSVHHPPLSPADLAVIESTLSSIPSHFSNSSVCPDLLLGIGDSLKLLDSAKSTTLPSGYRLLQSSIGPLVAGSEHVSATAPVTTRSQPITPAIKVASLINHGDDSLDQKNESVHSDDQIDSVHETTEQVPCKQSNPNIVPTLYKDRSLSSHSNPLIEDPPWPDRKQTDPQCRTTGSFPVWVPSIFTIHSQNAKTSARRENHSPPHVHSLKVASVTTHPHVMPSHSSPSFIHPFIHSSLNHSSSFPSPEDSTVHTHCNSNSFTHSIPASPRPIRVRWKHRSAHVHPHSLAQVRARCRRPRQGQSSLGVDPPPLPSIHRSTLDHQ